MQQQSEGGRDCFVAKRALARRNNFRADKKMIKFARQPRHLEEVYDKNSFSFLEFERMENEKYFSLHERFIIKNHVFIAKFFLPRVPFVRKVSKRFAVHKQIVQYFSSLTGADRKHCLIGMKLKKKKASSAAAFYNLRLLWKFMLPPFAPIKICSRLALQESGGSCVGDCLREACSIHETYAIGGERSH